VVPSGVFPIQQFSKKKRLFVSGDSANSFMSVNKFLSLFKYHPYLIISSDTRHILVQYAILGSVAMVMHCDVINAV